MGSGCELLTAKDISTESVCLEIICYLRYFIKIFGSSTAEKGSSSFCGRLATHAWTQTIDCKNVALDLICLQTGATFCNKAGETQSRCFYKKSGPSCLVLLNGALFHLRLLWLVKVAVDWIFFYINKGKSLV